LTWLDQRGEPIFQDVLDGTPLVVVQYQRDEALNRVADLYILVTKVCKVVGAPQKLLPATTFVVRFQVNDCFPRLDFPFQFGKGEILLVVSCFDIVY
jgi:hypothetical protein